MIRKIWNHTWVRLTATFILTVTVAAYGALVFASWHVTKPTQANGREIIASYNTVSAASATDYTWTSYLDAQTALNAVVAAGGGSLEFLGGAYLPALLRRGNVFLSANYQNKKRVQYLGNGYFNAWTSNCAGYDALDSQ